MIKFIIHLSKYIPARRGRFINKRIKLNAPDLMTAYNKSLELNKGFSVNMIWPEHKPIKKEFTLFDSINESLRCFPIKISQTFS